MNTKFNPDIHHRHSIRLQNYDYSQAGLYFITLCVQNRECIFGEITDGKIRLNEIGEIAQNCWLEIPQHYPDTGLHNFVVMPNHIHGIIEITANVGVQNVGVQNFEPLHAQNISDWLQTARTAFENSEYRTVLTNVAKIEEAVGSTTKPATAYLRIMSHYRLREYEQCISSANAYLADKPAQDETLQEINNALADSKQRLSEQQQKTVEQAEIAKWLKDKLSELFWNQRDLTIEVEPCQITLYHTYEQGGKLTKLKEVYPAKSFQISFSKPYDLYTITYSGKDVSEINLETSNTIHYASSLFLRKEGVTPAMVGEIEKKICDLHKLCEK